MWYLNGKLAVCCELATLVQAMTETMFWRSRDGHACKRAHVHTHAHMCVKNRTTHPAEQSHKTTHLIMLLIKPGAQKANNTHCTDDRTAGFKSSCASVQINGMLLISTRACVCVHVLIL